MKRYVCAAVVAASVLGFASSVSAAVMTVTLSGKITEGTDHVGNTFGAFNLANADYLAVFTYDTAFGAPGFYDNAGNKTLSGEYAANPLRKLVVTINSKTDVLNMADLGGYRFGEISRSSYPGFNGFSMYGLGGGLYLEGDAPATSGDFQQFGGRFTSGSPIPLDMAAPIDVPVAGGQFGVLRQVRNEGGGFDFAYELRGTVTNAKVAGFAPPAVGVGPVPEPATWAMMLVGFFGLGGVLRRSRRYPAVA
jgi:hypothetical protein